MRVKYCNKKSFRNCRPCSSGQWGFRCQIDFLSADSRQQKFSMRIRDNKVFNGDSWQQSHQLGSMSSLSSFLVQVAQISPQPARSLRLRYTCMGNFPNLLLCFLWSDRSSYVNTLIAELEITTHFELTVTLDRYCKINTTKLSSHNSCNSRSSRNSHNCKSIHPTCPCSPTFVWLEGKGTKGALLGQVVLNFSSNLDKNLDLLSPGHQIYSMSC